MGRGASRSRMNAIRQPEHDFLDMGCAFFDWFCRLGLPELLYYVIRGSPLLQGQ